MDKCKLRRRYNYLWTGEICSVILFATLLAWSIYQDGMWQHWIARTYSLAIVILILIQGVTWWRLKLRLLRRNELHIPPHILKLYRLWRQINWLLIGSFPFVVVIGVQVTLQPIASTDTWLG
jgi:hypothetical protein